MLVLQKNVKDPYWPTNGGFYAVHLLRIDPCLGNIEESFSSFPYSTDNWVGSQILAKNIGIAMLQDVFFMITIQKLT